MTQTKASRKRNHQDLEEDGGVFLPASKRRDFNFNRASLLRSNGHTSPGHDEVDAMQRLQILEAAGNDPSYMHAHSTSPKMSGAVVSPSTHPSQQFPLPPHHQRQLHPPPASPCSPTSPHNGHQIPATQLLSGQAHFQAAGSDVLGLPNVPVSPAHSPQGLSNSLSNSQYDDINRILREAHFSRMTRINGVELRPDELHL